VLIRAAELDYGARIVDLRIDDGRICQIAERLVPYAAEPVIDAGGCALLPSLHDAHIHLYAAAAAAASVRCGPPHCGDAAALAAVLKRRDAELPAGEWLRGVGFHDTVMTDSDVALDRHWLDHVLPQRPVRIQHRSGRLWLLNIAALRQLGIDPDAVGDDPLERIDGRATGRLYDADAWLRARLPAQRPDLTLLSRQLWSLGVTSVTDTSHDNDADSFRALGAAQARGELLQDICVMGGAGLDVVRDAENEGRRLQRGAHKFHLHDHALPDFDALCAQIRQAHAAGRPVAFHCVSRVDLTFALAVLQATGSVAGDRIEHASVAPPELVEQVAALGLTVVTQPLLVTERGDDYLREVDADDQPWLYRLRGWLDAGVPLAASSDAPYGAPDPWAAMAAAVARRTRAGSVLGVDEALNPRQALEGWLGSADTPGAARRIDVGAPADLCLMAHPWSALADRIAAGTARPQRVFQRGVEAPV
jgi:predicted amidohydrolase YtcJ